MEEKLLGAEYSTSKKTIGLISIMVIYFFYCYNFSLGIFVQPTMMMSPADGGFGFSSTQAAQIFAVMSFATIPGTIIFGILASKIGKKYTLVAISFLIGLSTALPFLDTDNFMLWLVSRFITGLVLGGVFGTAQPLVASMYQKKYRGKLAAVLTSLFSLSMIFAGFMYGVLGDANWHILMLTAIIPPLFAGVLAIFFVPNDQLEKPASDENSVKKEKISYLQMYKGKYLWIGILVICLSGLNFAGYSVYSNNATSYFTLELGFDSATAGAIFSLQGTGLLIGYYLWGFIADKFGRKVPLIGMALSGIVVFMFTLVPVDNIQLFYIMSFLVGILFGYSGIWGAYYTELFPQKFSSLSAGMSFNGGRIISTIAVPLLTSLQVTTGSFKMTFIAAAITLIIGAIIWVVLPETLEKN